MLQVTKTTHVAYCSADLADEMLGIEVPEGQHGYRLIDDKLVPTSLLDRIEYHLVSSTFDATKVYTAQKMVNEAFWQALDIAEQESLPACLFLLIDEGRITFTFPE